MNSVGEYYTLVQLPLQHQQSKQRECPTEYAEHTEPSGRESIPQIDTDAHRLGGYGIPAIPTPPITQPNHLWKSVKSVGENPLPETSVNSVKSVGEYPTLETSVNSVNSMGEYPTPETSVNSVKSVGEYPTPETSVNSVNSVGENPLPEASVNSVNSVGGLAEGGVGMAGCHTLLQEKSVGEHDHSKKQQQSKQRNKI